MRNLLIIFLLSCLVAFNGCNNHRSEDIRPNVIILLTDDQGYGDIGLHGNTIIETPQIDKLGKESVQFTQFFVSPLCQPTRASLMTGKNKVIGRRIEQNEQTLPQLFKTGGYSTAIFGKWHLGEYFPFRPIDKGFDEQLLIGAGAIGQTQDYWGNSSFDPFLFNGSDWNQYSGFCTDVLFDEAMSWMKQKSDNDEPFFCFLSTNAAHSPFVAPEEYKKPYLEKGLNQKQASFYGMITNIDDNLGRLRKHIKEIGEEENTIIIFLTDNGSTVGGIHKNKMRGDKASIYEGGSRAAAFFYWKGKFTSDKNISNLAMHYDILPTFSELLNIPLASGDQWTDIEGKSLAPLLTGKEMKKEERYHIIYQGFWPPNEPLSQYQNTSIRSQEFRLANGNELYHLKTDPGEKTNIISNNSEKADELRACYDSWWDIMSPELENLRVYNPYPVGEQIGQEITMTALHYFDSKSYPEAIKWYEAKFWLQSGLKELLIDEQNESPKMEPLLGQWKMNFQSTGIYRFTLKKGTESAPKELTIIKPGISYIALNRNTVSQKINERSNEIIMEVEVTQTGEQMIECWFEGQRTDNKPTGAYFVDMVRIN